MQVLKHTFGVDGIYGSKLYQSEWDKFYTVVQEDRKDH